LKFKKLFGNLAHCEKQGERFMRDKKKKRTKQGYIYVKKHLTSYRRREIDFDHAVSRTRNSPRIILDL
jgi:hypothetical protein